MLNILYDSLSLIQIQYPKKNLSRVVNAPLNFQRGNAYYIFLPTA